MGSVGMPDKMMVREKRLPLSIRPEFLDVKINLDKNTHS
jgi:hypothetical protein